MTKRTQPITTKRIKNAITNLAEKKVVVVGNSAVTITTAGTVINLSNNVAQGDEFFNRSGDKITVLKQLLKFRFVAITNSQTCRVILIKDNFNQGNTPVIGEILAGNFLSSYQQLTVMQQRRFSILQDFSLDCNLNGETVKSKWCSVNKPHQVWFNGSTSVSASNGRGALFLVVIGSNSTGTYDFSWESTYNDS